MFSRIDHVGIVVKNFESAVDMYEKAFGLKPMKIETLEKAKVKIAFIFCGEVLVELLTPTEWGEGTIGEFLEKNGEGLHHIAYRVENIHRALDTLKQMDIRLRDNEPRDGGGGSKIAFLDPASTQNVLTELVQRDQEIKAA